MLKRLFRNVFCCVICAILVSGIFCFICLKGNDKTETVAKTGYGSMLRSSYNQKKDSAYLQDITVLKKENSIKKHYRDKKCLNIYNKNKECLMLVNRDNPLPEDYSYSLKYICNGRLQASSYLYDSLVKMLDDAKIQGYSYWIASAYRSYEKQQRLVEEDVNILVGKGMSYINALEEVYKETMPAGCSEHQTGLALDILCSGNTNMDVSQMDEPGNKWLRENCYKYGFILRYPEDKSAVTGVNFEPWHFRYVGKEAAKYITKNNITLEEFYKKLGNI
ncbi:MAG: M15 family metallopeptidase [Lachnospiraceae bacterium]|nr:M15 family metallopeptidase [Lachnospiraceae bacterium]